MKTMEAKKTKHISRRFRNFLRANEAVSALEYALLVGIVAVGLTGAIVGFSGNIEDALTAIGTENRDRKHRGDGWNSDRQQLVFHQ